MNTTPTATTAEDRIWAVLSHLSSLAFGVGIILPVIGWSDQRRKSRYASFQSLQALGYQSLGYTIWLLSLLVVVILLTVVLLAIFRSRGGNIEDPNTVFAITVIVFSVIFGFFILYILFPIIAAVTCAFGRDYRYPILGDRLARYLGYDPKQDSEEPIRLSEEHEFRWVAAMGHFSILIALWGMLVPLTAWILYGKQSFFLKFQSIQTVAYQAAVNILFFVGLLMYSVGLILLTVGVGAIGGTGVNSSFAIISIAIFGSLLLIAFLIILLLPLLHILGQWAGARVLKGDNYHYPLIGKLVAKWISKHSITEEKPV
jgi:uncharacterized Tic20 family protein